MTHVCEIDPVHARNNNEPPISETGKGNREYNTRGPEWDGFDFAFKVNPAYALVKSISLARLKTDFGLQCVPHGRMYLPQTIKDAYSLDDSKKGTHVSPQIANKKNTDTTK